MAVEFDSHPNFQGFAHPERLVSAAWLSARLGTPGLTVVESDEDAYLYNIGHIPTAVRIDWRKDLNNPHVRDLIDGEAFAALMREKGINREDTVVIYGDQRNWWAAYTFWVFTLFGHKDVRLLDGGRDAWMAEERDTSFVVPEPKPTDYPVIERDDATNRIFVGELKERHESLTILDVRPAEKYRGEHEEDGAVTRPGRIPSAVSVPWGRSVRPNALFRSPTEIREAFDDLDASTETVVYSQLGDRSAHTWFVLKYLMGFDSVRNYDGSWVEWGNMVGMPIERD